MLLGVAVLGLSTSYATVDAEHMTPQSVELLTLQGITVFKGDISEFSPDVIPSGFYIRRIMSPDGRISVSKVSY
ncbi:MAG: hypothetical protein K2N76_04995 [Muribaculaceae bacterium]|nr:hypothetical protein [Muribaculaceae bacterium]